MNLTPTDTARRTQTPPLQGRGKGWGLTANTIVELQDRARNMRNNPTEPEKRLWRNLSHGQLEGWKFRRQQVIGNRIVDFLCPQARLIVEVDGDTHDAEADAVRDKDLQRQGYQVLRITNREVMRNMDGVKSALLQALVSVARPHPNPSPEGDGLSSGIPV